MSSNRFTTGLLLALLGSIAFSGKAIIVKLAYRYGVDAVTLLMYRMLFSLPFFAIMAWWASRGKAALAYITASLERLILYINPTLVLIMAWLLYKKPISARQIAAMALSYSGILLVFGHELVMQEFGAGGGMSTSAANTVWGSFLVFASAISYAIYLGYSGELVKRLGSLRLVGLATTVACVLCILQFVLMRPISAMQVAPEVIWLSLLNATLCTALPVVAVMMAIERIGAPLAAQTGMIGPMSTILMGVFILGEPLTIWVVLGTVLVLSGVYWVSRGNGRGRAKA